MRQVRINRQMIDERVRLLDVNLSPCSNAVSLNEGPLHPESVSRPMRFDQRYHDRHLLVSPFGPSVAFPAPVTVSPTMPDREQACGPNLPHFRVPKSVEVEKHRMSLPVVKTVH